MSKDVLGRNEKRGLRLTGERIYLRPVRTSDVNETYCRWMNDPQTNRYLESRFSKHSIASLKAYVAEKEDDGQNAFFAIILKEGDRHIGNIKLGPVDEHHRSGDIGILIGEKDCRGKGYGAEAIRLIVRYAFERLGLHKVTAGCYAPNKGSIAAFQKAGFAIEGVRKSHCYCDGEYVDDILLGLVRPEAGPAVKQDAR